MAKHPAPWKWDVDPTGDWRLRAANGLSVIPINSVGETTPSPRVRALTELAPNLELLKDIQWSASYGHDADDCCPVCANMRYGDGCHESDCWLGNTIAQLDAVKD